MNKLLGLILSVIFLFSIFSFGFTAHANFMGINDTISNTIDNQDNFPWRNMDRGMMGYGYGIRTTEGSLGTLWIIGWLFSIGYLRLTFWRGVLALIIWPYYLGKKFYKHV